MNLRRILAILTALAVSLLITLPITASSDGGSFVVTLYNESNGLPTGEANEVVQTSDGYIWIGSYGGLIRYDGTSFENYSLEGRIPSSSVRALYEGGDGTLWIGTNDAGVFAMRGQEITKIPCADENSFLCIRDFAEGDDGAVYVASNSGMGMIKDDVLSPMSGENIVGGTVYSVDVDSEGRVWGALNAGVCAVAEGGAEKAVFRSEDFFTGGESAYCTGSDTAGNIYIGSSGNVLAKLSFNGKSLEPADFTTEYITTEGVMTHNAIKTAPDGKIIVCGNVGACVISPDGSQISFSDAEKAASLNSGCLDYEGNVWLASTAFGIIKYTRGCFSSPNDLSGLGGTPINAVSKQGGYYFAATDTGLLSFDEGWNPVENDFTALFNGVRVRCLLADSSGGIWAASYAPRDSLARFDPKTGELKTYNTSDGLLSSNARTLYELSDGSIAVGTQEGLNIIRNGEVAESYGSADGISVASVLCITEGRDGSVLIGSDGGGIYEIKDGKVTNHSFDEGLPDGVVLRMLDDGGKGYFISAGSSLYYWDGSGFRKIDIKKGAGSIFDFYLRDGKLWILQNSGILAFDRDSLLNGEETVSQSFGFEHGLSGSLNANTWSWTDPDSGDLYIATRSGISVFGFKGVDNALRRIIINSINIDGEEIQNPSAPIQLSSDVRRISLDFSALTYTETANIAIEYVLEGFDSAPSTVFGSANAAVSYTNLSGGEYTFTASVYEVGNPDNSATVRLEIIKEKKPYEHVGFIAAIIILGAAAVFAIVMVFARAKVKTAQKRQQQYRSIVEQSLQTFARSIDAKDRYTNGHSLRVAEYSRELARRLGMTAADQERIYYIALLHDIGKIGIPDSVLNKPGKLTDEEREIIQNHPKIGGEILKKFTAIEGIAEGAKYHHERIDGKGYNSGLKGDEIPLIARIIGVADTYDAMSSDRPYRKALPSDFIVGELKRVSGTQLDPKIVPHMLRMIEDGTAPISQDKHKDASDISAHYHNDF